MSINLTGSPVFVHFCCLTRRSLDYIFYPRFPSVAFSPLLFTCCLVLSSPLKHHPLPGSRNNYSEVADNCFYCSVWLTRAYSVCSHVFPLQASIWSFSFSKQKFPDSTGSVWMLYSALVSHLIMHNSCFAIKPAEGAFLFFCENGSHRHF